MVIRGLNAALEFLEDDLKVSAVPAKLAGGQRPRIDAIMAQFAVGRALEADQNAAKRGLAGARFADNAKRFSGVHRQ